MASSPHHASLRQCTTPLDSILACSTSLGWLVYLAFMVGAATSLLALIVVRRDSWRRVTLLAHCALVVTAIAAEVMVRLVREVHRTPVPEALWSTVGWLEVAACVWVTFLLLSLHLGWNTSPFGNAVAGIALALTWTPAINVHFHAPTLDRWVWIGLSALVPPITLVHIHLVHKVSMTPRTEAPV